jgi:Histidine kinase
MNAKIQGSFLLLLLNFGPLAAQQNDCVCAEEAKRRPTIIRHFSMGQIDSAVLEFNAIGREGSPECRISYLNSMAQYSFMKNDSKGVEKFLKEERRLLDSVKCGKRAYVRHFNTKGNYYLGVNQYEKMAESFLAALKNSEGIDYPFGKERALLGLALAFHNLQQFDKELYYEKKAEKVARSLGDPNELGIVLQRIAGTYNNRYELKKQKQDLDSARVYASQALKLGKQVQNLHLCTDAYVSLAFHAFYIKKYQQSIAYSDSIFKIAPQDMGNMYRYEAFLLSSRAHLSLKRNQQAAVFADSALQAAKMFNPQMTINALQQVYEAQKALNNFPRALEAYEQLDKVQDSLANLDRFKAINQLEAKYNKIQNEQKIAELSQQKALAKARNQQLGLGLLAAALVIVVLVFQQRQRSLKNKQVTLETEQRLNRARMNPHFFFNALGALQGLALKTNDVKVVVKYLHKFAAIMRHTLESTYQDYIPLSQEKAYLEQYLELQSLRFPSSFAYQISIDEDIDEDELKIPSMLLQPLVENAIEHGFSGQKQNNVLDIRFVKTLNHSLLLEVADNGKGLSTGEKERKHLSRAMQIVRDRLSLIENLTRGQTRFQLQNQSSGGVLAQIYLPVLS